MKRLARAAVDHVVTTTREHPFFAPRAVFGKYRNPELLLGERCGLSEERARDLDAGLQKSARKTIRRLGTSLRRQFRSAPNDGLDQILSELLFCASREGALPSIREEVTYAIVRAAEESQLMKKRSDSQAKSIIRALRILNVDQFRIRDFTTRHFFKFDLGFAFGGLLLIPFASIAGTMIFTTYMGLAALMSRRLARYEATISIGPDLDGASFVRDTGILEAIDKTFTPGGHGIGGAILGTGIIRREIRARSSVCACLAVAHEALRTHATVVADMVARRGSVSKQFFLTDGELSCIKAGLTELCDAELSMAIAALFKNFRYLEPTAEDILAQVRSANGGTVPDIDFDEHAIVLPVDLQILLLGHFDPQAVRFGHGKGTHAGFVH